MKTHIKVTLTFVALIAISTVGFGTAFGYGGGGGYINTPGFVVSSQVRPVITLPAQASNVAKQAVVPGKGKVLGASSFKFVSFIRQGAVSDAVRELQERLRAEGFFKYPTSTGYFGPVTLAAVIQYQGAHGLPGTGYVGPLTTAELNK